MEDKSCSCHPLESCENTLKSKKEYWIKGQVNTLVGSIPQVSTSLDFKDVMGSWKVRWGINRMNYKVNPGLYCAGNPDSNAPVLVTANYKMSFDRLRKELAGLNVWLLVLDTKGVNVWCAAGKGTFGTNELVGRMVREKLPHIVSHRTIILPQLGAPGVSGYEVQRRTGFKVIYGPIRANDIKEFINSGFKATPEMRSIKFTIFNRLVLTPIELIAALKISVFVFGILFLLNLIGLGPFGIVDFYAYIGSLFLGCVLTPILLPWIPGRAFAWKGWLLCIIWALAVNILNGWPKYLSYSEFKALSYIFLLPPVSAYYAMGFTGSSTYTSFSGVKKELKIAIPLMIISICIGICLILIDSIKL